MSFDRVILVEGITDIKFMHWFLQKLNYSFDFHSNKSTAQNDNCYLIECNGKDKFLQHIEDILGRVNNKKIKIDFANSTINKFLMIMDYDINNHTDKIKLTKINDLLKSKEKFCQYHYIAGDNKEPPRTLETLYLEYGNDLLCSFSKNIRDFSKNRQDNNKTYFDKMTDKAIFAGFNKINQDKNYNFDLIFGDNFNSLSKENIIKELSEELQKFLS